MNLFYSVINQNFPFASIFFIHFSRSTYLYLYLIIGVGQRVDQNQLEAIVHDSNNIHYINSFKALESQKEKLMNSLTSNICPTDACPGFAKQDIIFLVDSSNNMINQTSETDTFEGVKGALSQLIMNDVNPTLSGVRIALITYDATAIRVIDFDNAQRARELKQRIDSQMKVSLPNSAQNLAGGLDKVLELTDRVQTSGMRDLFFDFEKTPQAWFIKFPKIEILYRRRIIDFKPVLVLYLKIESKYLRIVETKS